MELDKRECMLMVGNLHSVDPYLQHMMWKVVSHFCRKNEVYVFNFLQFFLKCRKKSRKLLHTDPNSSKRPFCRKNEVSISAIFAKMPEKLKKFTTYRIGLPTIDRIIEVCRKNSRTENRGLPVLSMHSLHTPSMLYKGHYDFETSAVP